MNDNLINLLCKELIDLCKDEKIHIYPHNKLKLIEFVNKQDKINIKNKYNVISLFTGIGGMDMGFGGEVIVHRL